METAALIQQSKNELKKAEINQSIALASAKSLHVSQAQKEISH